LKKLSSGASIDSSLHRQAVHKNSVLDADSFDIVVRRRVCGATIASDVTSGHTSRLTHKQHLAFP
jgi:hypothetical protein